ncbi:FAD-dependent oxidoreductase [Paraclostridium sordellii]|uniref:FAD-dependent oxidoreductase n=1 Tax=Paraclostridium sordellii TaxID=1505 RepID=UPI0005DDB152|nr:FAD-dependent oxidoreductase [Paeniclostridium sordellii]CEQ14945.1 oxidoreductase [[Clostridium] sordellii] [Paeniclostridium sordellii]
MELKSLELKKDLYWVGSLDPSLRVFDIIMYTPYGTTYNSYVLKANEKTILFESVKAKHFDSYLARLESLNIDLEKIDYIVVSHTEPDHAGSVERILKLSPKAKVIASQNAINYLKEIVNCDFNYIKVEDNDELKIGNKTLKFYSVPLLHWPDTIYTYIKEDEVLVTCDSFGSHYSCEGIINTKIENKDHYMEALRYYYECIMGPFKPYVLKAIDKIRALKLDIICPGHGPVLVENPREIVDIYEKWSKEEIVIPRKDITICYVSAYGYTEELAQNIKKGIEEHSDYDVKMYDVIHHDMAEILNSITYSQGVLFGTPTINGDALKPIWDILVNLNPIVHGTKLATAFGSYGWSGEGIPNVMDRLRQLRMKTIEPLVVNFKPSEKDLYEAQLLGKKFVEKTIDAYTKKEGSKKWKCVICNEVFEGDEAPDVCPVCGAKHDQFIEVIEEEISYKNDTNESFVIVGNGAAGFYAADAIRKRNNTAKITMISNEDELTYFRPALSDFINEEVKDKDFYVVDKSWYNENNIDVILGVTVNKINENSKKVNLDNNTEVSYDKLILANGSSNFIPPIKGHDLDGVYTLRNKSDLEKIKNNLNNASKIVVIGGGLLGLEAAYEMKLAQKDVTVIEAMPNLLSKQLDKDGSLILENILKENGLNLMTNTFLESIEGEEKVTKVIFKDGSCLDADMVLFSIGVRSNTSIAKETNIKIDKGIIVDKNMKTSANDIYACGDVAEIDSMVWAIWPAAIDMGKVAGANACGDNTSFKVENYSVMLDVFDTKVFSIGDIKNSNGCISLNNDNKYKKLFFKDDILTGAIFINDLSSNVKTISLILEKANISEVINSNLL